MSTCQQGRIHAEDLFYGRIYYPLPNHKIIIWPSNHIWKIYVHTQYSIGGIWKMYRQNMLRLQSKVVLNASIGYLIEAIQELLGKKQCDKAWQFGTYRKTSIIKEKFEKHHAICFNAAKFVFKIVSWNVCTISRWILNWPSITVAVWIENVMINAEGHFVLFQCCFKHNRLLPHRF